MTDLESAWAELQRQGSIRPQYLKDLKDEVSGELARCLEPFVHEQNIRPYGAIVARETPHLEQMGRIFETADLSSDVLRGMADGRHSLVLVVKGELPRLLLLHESLVTDQDYASHAMWVDGLIVCNDSQGIVRIVTASSITLVEGRRWTARNLVFEAAEDIVQVVPAADTDVVRRILEFSHHQISAQKIGATLLYMLTDDEASTRRRADGINVAGLNLSVLNVAEEPLFLHQARYRDGALLVGRGGRLLAVNVMLRPTKASEEAVAATGGTRHTSAARHTYDCPDVLAFVMSSDGPVTVFSDGQRVADLARSGVRKTAEMIEELVALRRAERRK